MKHARGLQLWLPCSVSALATAPHATHECVLHVRRTVEGHGVVRRVLQGLVLNLLLDLVHLCLSGGGPQQSTGQQVVSRLQQRPTIGATTLVCHLAAPPAT